MFGNIRRIGVNTCLYEKFRNIKFHLRVQNSLGVCESMGNLNPGSNARPVTIGAIAVLILTNKKRIYQTAHLIEWNTCLVQSLLLQQPTKFFPTIQFVQVEDTYNVKHTRKLEGPNLREPPVRY